MKISGFDPLKPGSGTKKTGSSSATGSSFASLLVGDTEDAAATHAASAPTPTAAISNLLALQEISEEDVHRRKLVQQGQNMVDVLERLRNQLLTGMISPAMIQELTRNIKLQKQVVNDPQLMAIVKDIELRAAVELAKLEMAQARQELLGD